jgi:hypothetical protein
LGAVIDDPAARASLGAIAKSRCEAHYKWELIADQVESFYYRVLSDG